MVFAVDPQSLGSMVTGDYDESRSPEALNARPFLRGRSKPVLTISTTPPPPPRIDMPASSDVAVSSDVPASPDASASSEVPVSPDGTAPSDAPVSFDASVSSEAVPTATSEEPLLGFIPPREPSADAAPLAGASDADDVWADDEAVRADDPITDLNDAGDSGVRDRGIGDDVAGHDGDGRGVEGRGDADGAAGSADGEEAGR
jgi:hypothetical protein